MAEETHKPEAAEAPATTTAEVVAVPEPEEPVKPAPVEEVVEGEKPKSDEVAKIDQSVSFKEESNVVSELPDPQKKALDELKQLVQDALNKHELTVLPPPPPPPKEEGKAPEVAVEEEKKKEKEEEKVEEKVPEGPKEAQTEEPPKVEQETVPVPVPAPAEEEKVEEKVVDPKPETKETVVITETVEEKVTVTDEDGAKTVEAIEETIVAVSTSAEPEAEVAPPAEAEPKEAEEVFIWGIKLLSDERSDVILLKFLRARDFKVKEAFTMIKNTVRWRKEFGIDALLEEDLGNEWDKVVFTHGFDKEGHPVCYNVFGEFENKELYQNTFGDEEKRLKFLKWRIQFLEKSIRNLDFSPNGISTIVQVNDLKNSPGLTKWELRTTTKQALQLLQDNYPEFLAKQVFINVPWWYLAVNRMISPFLTHRTKSKFVFAGPSKSAETLFKYIAPEQVPVQYGGLSREGEQEFTTSDSVTDVIIKPASKHTVEFPVSETGHFVWETRVVGWDVSYGAEFVPDAEGGYTVIVQKTRKIAPTDEPVIVNSFKIGEPGKIVLNIENQSSKKKKLIYRSKIKHSSD